MEFNGWCKSIEQRYQNLFNKKPPSFRTTDLDFSIQEAIMRSNVRAKYFGISEHDDLCKLVHYMALDKKLKLLGR